MSHSSDSSAEMPPPEGVSLDELTQAYAKAMGSPAAQTQPAAAAAVPAAEQPAAPFDEPRPADGPAGDPCPISPAAILEAMLFVGNRENAPLTAARAAELMRDVEADEIPPLVDRLNDRYSRNGCPYMICRDGAGYRMVLRRAFSGLRNRFYGRIREARLSQAAIDVLAVLAYRQPLTGEEIGKLRDRPSSHILSLLVRRGLLRVERLDPKKRTASYFTTDRFLALFNLASLDGLPQSEDLNRQ